jgi:nitroreductase
MDFIDLVKKRYSVRDYLETPVSDALIERVLEAGRLAPSACNNQPWVFIVIRGAEAKQRLQTVYARPWLQSAPVVIAVCCDRRRTWRRSDGRDFGDMDMAIAMDHMTLAAADAGLGTCWIGNFNAVEAKKALKLPQDIEPAVFTPLGFPGPKAVNTKTRKGLSDIVFWDYFGGTKQQTA